MKKKTVVLSLLTCILLVGGCADKNQDRYLLDSDKYNVAETDNTNITSDDKNLKVSYEYEIAELSTWRDGMQIYGTVYRPMEAEVHMPTVIFSHGIGGSGSDGATYADALAKQGYVVYCFDFCGGGLGSRSDGSTEEMSIFTEEKDLEAVITMIKEQDFVDENRIYLLGASQGGVVSAITAADHKEEIAGMVLLYPAFVLVDDAKERFGSPDNVPDRFRMFIPLGRTYAENLFNYDIYEDIKNYDKEVLIIHGDADEIAPVSYSEQGAKAGDEGFHDV